MNLPPVPPAIPIISGFLCDDSVADMILKYIVPLLSPQKRSQEESQTQVVEAWGEMARKNDNWRYNVSFDLDATEDQVLHHIIAYFKHWDSIRSHLSNISTVWKLLPLQ